MNKTSITWLKDISKSGLSKVDDNTWSMEVRRPYKDYNGGW